MKEALELIRKIEYDLSVLDSLLRKHGGCHAEESIKDTPQEGVQTRWVQVPELPEAWNHE